MYIVHVSEKFWLVEKDDQKGHYRWRPGEPGRKNAARFETKDDAVRAKKVSETAAGDPYTIALLTYVVQLGAYAGIFTFAPSGEIEKVEWVNTRECSQNVKQATSFTDFETAQAVAERIVCTPGQASPTVEIGWPLR